MVLETTVNPHEAQEVLAIPRGRSSAIVKRSSGKYAQAYRVFSEQTSYVFRGNCCFHPYHPSHKSYDFISFHVMFIELSHL
jgi:hypothetical protein